MAEVPGRADLRTVMLRSCICIVLSVLSGTSGVATAQVVLGSETPFYRFATEDAGDTVRNVQIGWDYRSVLDTREPYSVSETRVPVAEDNTFRLGDLVDPGQLSADAAGVVIALNSVWGKSHRYLVTPLDTETRVSALPSGMRDVTERRMRSVKAWAREVSALPRCHTSEPIRIPTEGARLDVGIGFEDILEHYGIRNLDDRTDNDDKRTPAVRARILLHDDDATHEVFSEVLRPQRGTPNRRRFNNFSIDLAAFAGHTVRVEFRFDADTPDGPATSPFAMPVWGDPVLLARTNAPSQKQNLILISLDTLRADHLGAYGYARDTSPNLDAFTAESTLFERCLSTSSWTTPAHASVFTGLPLTAHRAGSRESYWRLSGRATTLAELAQRRGYLTAAFTQGHAIAGRLGFAQGFDRYSDGPLSGIPPNSSGRAVEVFKQARNWLDLFDEMPFVLFVHTYEIHAPYLPPEPFTHRYTDAEPGDGFSQPGMNDADRQRIRDLYDAGIAYTDDVVGRFLDDLRDRDLLRTTHVVIFSDHGEEFWEHGGIQHSFTLYQEQLHVPLLIRPAGPTQTGQRISTRVSLTDLFATTASLLRLKITPPATSFDLTTLIEEPSTPYPRSFQHAELYKTNKDYFMAAGIEGSYKYIAKTRYDQADSPLHPSALISDPATSADNEIAFLRSLHRENSPDTTEQRLFNLAVDPLEQTSVFESQPEVAERLRTRLVEVIQASAMPVSGRPEQAPELSDAEKEQLRALGYLE